MQKNEIGLCGLDFIEFSSHQPEKIEELFLAFGFSKLKKHHSKNINYFKQNDIHFFLNQESGGTAQNFSDKHGPCASAMGWRFHQPKEAHRFAVERGARPAIGDFKTKDGTPIPAIEGIGGMLIYFMSPEEHKNSYTNLGFENLQNPIINQDKGFLVVDHLTNNVEKGTMAHWAEFYKNIFGFTEVRYFDIRGAKTGLTSYALRSPDGSFCIPINEGTESKSQINEYLEEYKGPGVQHIAFLTDNILDSLDSLQNSRIETLDIDDEYYQDIFHKFPNVVEDSKRIRDHNVLVDGDSEGYLLQIFTKNIIGPIFIEMIQRRNNYSFGEGNFGALFRSIERDQMKRGYIKE